MKGLIFLYSGSGNTKLACHKLMASLPAVQFELCDITTLTAPDYLPPDLTPYDLIGFATFTDFMAPPQLMKTFIEALPRCDKRAFVLTTYGYISGQTPQVLARWAQARGFRVFNGFALHCPESYPPMIAKGKGNEQAPNEAELARFTAFIERLRRAIGELGAGRAIVARPITVGLFNAVIPVMSRLSARKDMGVKTVDAALCTQCGSCRKGCPYQAITMDPGPLFDMTKCYGCWACYHRCPKKAIHTATFHGQAQYPRPLAAYAAKMRPETAPTTPAGTPHPG